MVTGILPPGNQPVYASASALRSCPHLFDSAQDSRAEPVPQTALATCRSAVGLRNAHWPDMLAFDDAGQLVRITAPTLILGGEQDGLFAGVDGQQRLAAAIPGAQLTVYPEPATRPTGSARSASAPTSKGSWAFVAPSTTFVPVAETHMSHGFRSEFFLTRSATPIHTRHARSAHGHRPRSRRQVRARVDGRNYGSSR
jgi:predicted dienelactone hydrolase